MKFWQKVAIGLWGIMALVAAAIWLGWGYAHAALYVLGGVTVALQLVGAADMRRKVREMREGDPEAEKGRTMDEAASRLGAIHGASDIGEVMEDVQEGDR